MSNLFLKDLLVYTILIGVVLYVTYIYNIWGTGKGNTKAKDDTKKDRQKIKKRNRLIYWLNKFEYVGNNIGLTPRDSVIQDYEYKLSRINWNLKDLNRTLKPMELIGIMKVIKFVSVAIAVLGLIATGIPIFALFFLGLCVNMVFSGYASACINDTDIDIEAEFPSLYLILCTQLYRGAYSRLSPTLDEYLKSLDSMYGEKSHKAIKEFVLDMRKNIEIYGDDSMAINKLREKYRSAMVINFCNLAVQSLSGVDNKDKLIAFKLELEGKQLKAMEKRANHLVAKGRRAIWVVYIILAQFVVLSWIAKLGGSGMLN